MIQALTKKTKDNETLRKKSCCSKLRLFFLNNYNRIFKWMENKGDKKQLQDIQKKEKRLTTILDLEEVIKDHHKLAFFQKIILKKLDINSEKYE